MTDTPHFPSFVNPLHVQIARASDELFRLEYLFGHPLTDVQNSLRALHCYHTHDEYVKPNGAEGESPLYFH